MKWCRQNLQEGTEMRGEQPLMEMVWTVSTPLWQDNRATFPLPLAMKEPKLGEKYSTNLPQVMSLTQPHGMNR
jgi:hypothetical protein